MIKYEKQMIETSIPTKLICNKSGKEADLTNEDYIASNRTHSFKVSFGYGSDFDMDTWEFDLDEDSLLEFVKTFKIRPTGFAKEDKYPDEIFEEWKRTGKYNWKAGWTEEDYDNDRKQREEHEQKMNEVREMFKNHRQSKTIK